MKDTLVLTASSPDRPGIVAALTSALTGCGANIVDAQQFNERREDHFFMRVVFETEQPVERISGAIEALAPAYDLIWNIERKDVPKKVVILVSKFDHCLDDLIYRVRIGELQMKIVAIASNHPRDATVSASSADIPFFYFPISADTKAAQEAKIRSLVEETGADLVILARYMQILSNEFAGYLAGRCINIHHSFLPGFKGAKPYHQAFDRGVKMIGATAHYATADLDEGPIITQDVERISHSDSPDDLVRKGRDIERRVLARAIRYHLAGRVFIHKHKTIVFED